MSHVSSDLNRRVSKRPKSGRIVTERKLSHCSLENKPDQLFTNKDVNDLQKLWRICTALRWSLARYFVLLELVKRLIRLV
jgi:hypothetical protein